MQIRSVLASLAVVLPLGCVSGQAPTSPTDFEPPPSPDGTYDSDWIYDESLDDGQPHVHPGLTFPEDHACFAGVQFEEVRETLDFDFSCDASDLGWMPGKFIVGVQNGGYLRKISEVSQDGDHWTLLTTDAALQDVLANYSASFHWEPELLERDTHVAIPMPNLKFLSGKVSLVGGEFGFNGSMDYSVDFGWFRINESSIDLNFEPYVETVAAIKTVNAISASPSHTFSPDWNLANPTFAIGPVPVVVNMSLRRQLTSEFKLAGQINTQVSTSVHIPMTANAHYVRGRNPEWTAARSASIQATGRIDEITIETKTTAKIGYKLSLMALFYGVAGPAFSATPNLEGVIEPKCGGIDAEMTRGVDFSLSLEARIEDRGTTENDSGDNEDTTSPVEWELPSIKDATPIWAEHWDYPYGFTLPNCGGEECSNGLDDDGDKLIDCEDEDDCGARDACRMQCGTGETLSCGQIITKTAADFDDAPDLFNAYGCNVGNYDGPEFVFEWTAPSSAPVEFAFIDPNPTVTNLDIMILDAAQGCQGTSCVDFVLNSGEFEPVGGKTYYIVVDGFDGDEGDFQIEARCGR